MNRKGDSVTMGDIHLSAEKYGGNRSRLLVNGWNSRLNTCSLNGLWQKVNAPREK